MSMPASAEQITALILDKMTLADDVVSLVLGPVPGGSLPPFEAGAHIELEIADGVVRPYSLANDPAELDRYVLGVLREPESRGGSRGVHEALAAGMTVRLGAPRNLFPLNERAPHTVLLAGGIGVTPLLSMAYRLRGLGRSFEVHVCCRHNGRLPFAQVLLHGPFADSVHMHFDNGESSQRLDLRRTLASSPAGTELYVCGPAGFIDHAVATAEYLGWPASAVHLERFDAKPELSGGAFVVVLESSGIELQVPAERTLADVLIEHGVPVSFSCERGICGTCLTEVRSGIPDHRDLYQTDEQKQANTHITPCCSRSLTPRLVLAL
jgi:vanillate O-demethylase ferredoxin subunit